MNFDPSKVRDKLRESLASHQGGQLAIAEAGYREILDADPKNADANHLLGMLLYEQGDWRAALERLELAIHSEPDSALLHNAKAVVLLAAKDFSGAKAAVEIAIQFEPDFAEAHHNLSRAEQGLHGTVDGDDMAPKDVAAEMQAMLDHLSRDPYRTDVLREVFELGEQSGRLDMVVAACVSVLKKVPDCVAAHLSLGLVFSSRIPPEQLRKFHLGQRQSLWERAFHHLQTAARIRPCAETFDAWGLALLNANEQRKAIEKFNEAIACDSRFAKSFENRGRAWAELGETEKAKEDYTVAISIDPFQSLAQYDLARTNESADEAKESIAQLKEVLASQSLRKRQRSLLAFALGHRYERVGNFKAAFENFQIANQLKRHFEEEDVQSWASEVAEHKNTFRGEIVSGHHPETSNFIPVFIVAMPRSGTTLVETLLSRHPRVFAGGELFGISDIAHTLSKRLGSDARYPRCVWGLTSQDIRDLRKEYNELVFREARVIQRKEEIRDRVWVTDKMPTNFWHIGLISMLFPEAKIIHVERNPMDVALSCFKQNLTWPYCDLNAIAYYIKSYFELMAYWKVVFSSMITTVRYEELVTSPDRELTKLLDFCGVPRDESCAQNASNVAVQTPSKWQVRKPIYQSSVEGWKRYESEVSELYATMKKLGVEIS